AAALPTQLPTGGLATVWSRRTAERRIRHAVEAALHQFVPHVADDIGSGPVGPTTVPADKLQSAIFLATDIENSTTVAEGLPPEAHSALMKDYFALLFRVTFK